MRIQGPALPAKPKPWDDWARNPYLKTFCLALSGRESAASESISALTHLFADIDPHEDETWRSSYLFLFEASMILKDQELTDKILERFEGNVEKTTGANFISIIPRHLGEASFLLGRFARARAHFQDALQAAAELQFRPEIALIRFQLAGLLLEHYPDEKADAREHLDFALDEFTEMGMRPWLDKAKELRSNRYRQRL